MLRRTHVCHSRWLYPGNGNTMRKRAGGGSSGGYRGVGQELGSGGGVSWKAIGNVNIAPLKAYPNHYMYRSDKLYNGRTPSRGNLPSRMASFNMGYTGYFGELQHVGVRFSNPRATLRDHRPFALPKRPQLVKVCEHCYYWTDGLEHYNLCTMHNKSHWHRKQPELSPAEGYRPHGRQGGHRHSRATVFQVPLHRLGSTFPRTGMRFNDMGHTDWGCFDMWITLRRFHNVGSRAINKHYKFVPLNFPEL